MIRIIAEIGSVHDGSFGNALKLIQAAAAAGADAVKFQTHIAEAESVASAPAPAYFSDEPRLAYFRRTSFTMEQWKRLAEHAAGSGVTFLSSPFSFFSFCSCSLWRFRTCLKSLELPRTKSHRVKFQTSRF